ncbi:MAG: hypothetical protein AAB561_00015 [Patescibacteria group bacterium]
MKISPLKAFSVLTLAFALFFGLSVLFSEPVLAAGCKLTDALWSAESATTGVPIRMYIRGEGCNGYTVSIHAYTSSGGQEIIPGGLTAVFGNDTNADATYTFNPYGLTIANLIHYIASANNTQVQSKSIQLRIGTISPTPPPTATPSGTPGQTIKYEFDIPNPIKANDFIGLITEISRWITAIAIPIAVITIVYAGILWLTAGAYPKNVDKAKQVLRYALIGLAIIIIGRGFITLIESIINLGGSSGAPTTSQSGMPPPGSSTTPTPPGTSGSGSVGSLCQNSRDCASELHCGSRNVCQRAAGNSQGELCAVSLNCAAGLVCQGADSQNNRLGTCRQP